MPCSSRPWSSCPGRLVARPAIKSEKNTPIDRAVPVFWKVDRIPEAAPRYRAGTLLMIDAEFGELNIPTPIPLSVISAANAQYGKSTGKNIRPTKLAPNTSMPAVAKARAPNRSDRYPHAGPEIRNEAVRGSRYIPVQSGVSV